MSDKTKKEKFNVFNIFMIFFAFKPVEYLVREGKHFELTGKTVSILINTYDNLERLISIICHSPRWSVHERAGKIFWKIFTKSNILRNIVLKPGTFSIMKWQKPEIKYQSLAHLGNKEPECHEDFWSYYMKFIFMSQHLFFNPVMDKKININRLRIKTFKVQIGKEWLACQDQQDFTLNSYIWKCGKKRTMFCTLAENNQILL